MTDKTHLDHGCCDTARMIDLGLHEWARVSAQTTTSKPHKFFKPLLTEHTYSSFYGLGVRNGTDALINNDSMIAVPVDTRKKSPELPTGGHTRFKDRFIPSTKLMDLGGAIAKHTVDTKGVKIMVVPRYLCDETSLQFDTEAGNRYFTLSRKHWDGTPPM